MVEKEERRIEQIPEKIEKRDESAGTFDKTVIVENTRDTIPPPPPLPDPPSPKPEDKGD